MNKFLDRFIFLDDERIPEQVFSKYIDRFVIIRNSNDFWTFVFDNGYPEFISFDHDLGVNEPTGYDIAKQMVEYHLDDIIHIPNNFKFNVHSANPVGARNIESLLTNFMENLS